MKRVNPRLDQIKITEYRHWNDPKVKSLLVCMELGHTEFLKEHIYLTRHRNDRGSYLIYDGNTRYFLMESGSLPLLNMTILETDEDLIDIREKEKEIYWPGRTLEEVIGYLAHRADFYIPKLLEGTQAEG